MGASKLTRFPTLLGALAAAVLLGGVSVLAQRGASPASAKSDRPNIVFLLTDDQTKRDLRTAMPRTLGLIGDKGVTFKRAYVSTPLCCPARATFLTGQHAHNNGVEQNQGPNGGFQAFDQDDSLGVWLQQAGYHTVHIGKYMNGYGASVDSEDDPAPPVPPGWDEFLGYAGPNSGAYWGYILNENGTLHQYGDPTLPGNEQPDPADYQTDKYGELALDAIQDRADAGQDADPFYLSVSFSAPHEPAKKAPRHAANFAQAPLPKDPSYNEANMSDKPLYLQAQTAEPISPEREFGITTLYRKRLSTLYTVDTVVKKIVNKLKATDLWSNTYIVFGSDNSFFQGQHRLVTGKYLPYEHSAKVPLLVRGPGIPKDEITGEPVSNIDFAPTALEIAGAESSVIEDGRPGGLLPFAEEPLRRTGRPLLLEGFGAGTLDEEPTSAPNGGGGASISEASVGAPAYAAIRTKRWLWVEYVTGGRELYDLKKDPYQLRSLHDDPAYEEVRATLAMQLDKLRNCRGANATISTSCAKERSEPSPPG
jgi:arylsulfatase A-like enzyme